MKSLMETYTPLIKSLQDLNQEIRRRLSSMPSCTGQEMQSLGVWLGDLEQLEKDLKNASCLISQHSQILKLEWQAKLLKDGLEDLTGVD